MFDRRSLKLPIVLGVLMIVTVVVLTVGWVLLSVSSAMGAERTAPLYWAMLFVGTVFLVFVLVGVVMYLTLSVKAINLNRRQSNFIDSVTHELKSPIASLKLYLQTMNRHKVDERQQRDFCRFMLDDVERLDRLINHLLDAASLDKGADSREFEQVGQVELAQIITLCAESVCLRYHVPDETITLKLFPFLVRGRPVDLDMVFRNLIDNAVKYSGTDPHVEITMLANQDGQVVVRIADNGPGIPAKLRGKIFGRFVRLGSELEREKPGTGLGLYIVRNVVHRMRGKIRVHGRDGGLGTVFEMQLPGTRPGKDQQSEEQESFGGRALEGSHNMGPSM